MSVVKANFAADPIGTIRPLHGVNSGPMTKVFTYDARPQFLEAGFPFARLHDVEYPYGSGEFVDIPCIFKDFDADETKEENYHFGLTDEYLKHCVEVGCEPLFRLGVSIEHAAVKRHIFPPKDYAKWARICEHIIRHYTEGWANGFHWQIRYWEIWNEADLASRNMWQGTAEEFYELYCVSAVHLKNAFPHLKIGGCGFAACCNPFIEGFFRYIAAKPQRIPLDFYSWHRYFIHIEDLLADCAEVDALLARHGYSDIENIFDEWNYMRDWSDQSDSYVILKNHIGAAFCAAALCTMQTKTSIDAATYFEADVVKEWCGLFAVDKMSISSRKATVAPLKPFYAFKTFNELYKLRLARPAESDCGTVYAAAACDGSRAALMCANYRGEEEEVTFNLSGLPEGEYEIRIVDEERDFRRAAAFRSQGSACFTLPLKSNSIVYIGSVLP